MTAATSPRHLARWFAAGVVLLTALVLPTSPALAHGEQTQEPFLRASTVLIHDVEFSTDELAVGEELVVTGRVRIMDAWPDHTVEAPEVGYLSLVTPGPVVTISDRRLSGTFTPQSVHIHKGATYDFEVRARGRVPGRYHLHPSFAVEGVGTLAGAGQWVEVIGGNEFTNDVVLANDETIDLNSFGMGRVAGWHLICLVVALGWLAYWLRRPLLARGAAVNAGAGGSLVTRGDRHAGVVTAAIVAAVLAGGWIFTDTTLEGPLLPLQVARLEPEPAAVLEPFVTSEITRSAWRADETVMQVHMDVTNTGSSPVHLSRLQVAEFEVQEAMTVSPSTPIAPGQTTEVMVEIDGNYLAERNLLPLRDPQLRFTALLFFTDAAGNEQVAEVDEVSSPVLPL